MTSSRPFSLRTIAVRWAHGQPQEMYRWYRPATAGYPLEPSAVIRPWNRYTGRWKDVPLLNPRPGPYRP